MATYLANFQPHFSEVTALLHDLLMKEKNSFGRQINMGKHFVSRN